MELFLIIIIIILAYLLFKGKNTSGEKIKKETKKYGKALKEAASTFQKSVQEEEKISKEDIDNLSDATKVGVMATATIMEALYQPVKDDLDGKLPNEMWRDEMLIGFNGMLISYLLKTSLQNASGEEKGLAVMMVYGKLCPEQLDTIMKDFNHFARNPSEESQRGNKLANKLIDIITDTNIPNKDFLNEKDPIMKEALLTAAAHEQNPLNFGEDNKNAAIATAFWEGNINAYILEKFQ